MSSPSLLTRRRRILAALVLAVALVATVATITPFESSPAHAAGQLPCDLYRAGGTPCVAAYSTTRVITTGWNGGLYDVTRATGSPATTTIGAISDGYANAAAQDSFCASSSCTITRIIDQSGQGNDLTVYPRYPEGQQGTDNRPADAKALTVSVNGHKAYGLYMPPRVSYRRSFQTRGSNPVANTHGIATGTQPETIYEVVSGTNVNNGCCSDFGNAERLQTDDGAGTMDAINLSTLNGTVNVPEPLYANERSYGYGPWIQQDLENGVFEGRTPANTANHGNPTKFVTAVSRNYGTNAAGGFSLFGADATNGTAPASVSQWYTGQFPDRPIFTNDPNVYSPMRLEGSIVLGAGGDNSNGGTSSFFEGVMTAGAASVGVINQVQANIQAQHYDGANSGGGPGSTITHAGKCVDVSGDDVGGNGQAVQLWDCLPMAADQHWEGSAYGIHTLGTMSRCLDAVGNATANGTPVQLYDCNPSVAGQQWIVRADGTILNTQSGRCLDDPSGNLTNGTRLQLYDCNGNAAQKFSVTGGVPLLPAVQNQTVEPNNSTQNCVDVAGNDLALSGQAVQTFSCQTIVTGDPEAQDQKWIYHADTQKLTSQGLCLDILGNGTANFAKLEVYTCNTAGGQIFQFRADGTVFNPQSGRCLDIPQGKHDQEQLEIYDCIGGDAQHFTMN